MLLSILIPTYNTDCSTLATALVHQCVQTGITYELLVADDGSTDETCIVSNRRINTLPHAQYIECKPNKGRTATCNFLAQEAQGQWLLLCDSDMAVVREDFISKYVSAMTQAEVVIGGLLHPPTLPSPTVSLRYRYEAWVAKRLPLSKRQAEPWRSMSTANVLLRREVLLRYGFDLRCQHYGYEDTLLGRTLALHGHKAIYIDNPLLHLGLEPNEGYLAKVEVSLHTLHGLNDASIHADMPVSRLALRLQRWHLLPFVIGLFALFQKPWRKHLLGRKPYIPLLQAYKIGYYCTLMAKT